MITLIAYKPSGVDTCRQCVVGRWHSDFFCDVFNSEESFTLKLVELHKHNLTPCYKRRVEFDQPAPDGAWQIYLSLGSRLYEVMEDHFFFEDEDFRWFDLNRVAYQRAKEEVEKS